MTKYRLPDILGGQEVTLCEEDQSASSWVDLVRVWAKAADDEAALIEIRRGLLTEVPAEVVYGLWQGPQPAVSNAD